jgi:fermentation-respiration switch protein FrsA (DUF1100 family)
MKNIIHVFVISILLSFLFEYSIRAENLSPNDPEEQFEIEGAWQGVLHISSVELRIVFHVSKDTAGKLTATLDSPDQSAYGIPVTEVITWDDSIKFIINAVQGFYIGKTIEDSIMISGRWYQGGMSLPLDLRKTNIVEKLVRPQEPKEPLPYKQEEVTIENVSDSLTLAGTLTFPDKEGTFPAVILITGSGAQNRNEELMGHKPFLVLADHLTRNGIAVLRYDDRGVGNSTGNFSSATSEDFMHDALSAVEFLKTRKEINPKQIGLIGHSEGGIIAPIAAVNSNDVAFIVLMAGTGLRGDKILLLQTELIYRVNGSTEDDIKEALSSSEKIYNIILNESDSAAADLKMRALLEAVFNDLSDEEKSQVGSKDNYIDMSIKTMLSPWFRYFVKYDPYSTLTKVKCPVLAINGEKDLQVPPKENLAAIEKALKEGGNQNYKVLELTGLNHLFQTAETGSPMEYGKIEETFSPVALKTISDWIGELEK